MISSKTSFLLYFHILF